MDSKSNPRTGRGLTLIELIVVLAIVAMMVLASTKMLADAQEAVRISQSTIKCNAKARAASGRLRDDLRSLARDGFLAITYRQATYRTVDNVVHTKVFPHLVLMTVGTHQSLTGNSKANASRIEYGIGYEIDNNDTTNSADDVVRHLILYRRAVLHDPYGGQDQEQWALAEYGENIHRMRWIIARRLFKGLERVSENYNRYGAEDPVIRAPAIELPVMSIYDIRLRDDVWSYMIGPVPEMKIQWGRRDASGQRILWYDKDTPFDPQWSSKNSDYQDLNKAEDAPEFIDSQFGTDMYCALWTPRKMDNWPDAIRIELHVGKDPTQTYEIILNVAK